MIEGTIESIAFGGEGILRSGGLVTFVPMTAPQDIAKVEILSKKKNFARGKLSNLISPSPLRVNPRCSYFGRCGGCQLQHLNYSAQLMAKRTFIRDALKRIGKIDVDDFTIIPAEEQWHYRRHIRLRLQKEDKEGIAKFQFGAKSALFAQDPDSAQIACSQSSMSICAETRPAQKSSTLASKASLAIPSKGFRAGYAGWESAVFVPVDKCPLFTSEEESLFADLQPFLRSLSNEHIDEATLRLIKAKEGRFILAFQFSPHLPANFFLAQDVLKVNAKWQGIVMQSAEKQVEFGDTQAQVEVLGLKLLFSPYGFIQNHPSQSENLYCAILDALPEKSENILDLYCGIGATSLLAALKNKKVIGIESHDQTVALAKANATLNQVSTAEFHLGMAESLGVQFLKNFKADVVLCNPPRTGVDSMLLESLCQERPPCILYTSCMPSTLARDLQKLLQSGYRIASLQGFDMFPQTTHVEVLVKLLTT